MNETNLECFFINQLTISVRIIETNVFYLLKIYFLHFSIYDFLFQYIFEKSIFQLTVYANLFIKNHKII